MNKKYVLGLLLVLLVSAVVGAVMVLKPKTPEPKVHYHAGFVVFVDGQKQDFSDIKYMNMTPCAVKGSDSDVDEDPQIEKAHLHDNVGDVVHTETVGAVWGDLFTNLKFPIDYSHATGYLNGNKISDLKNQSINPDDSLVVFIGNVNPDLLTHAVAKEHIDEVAKKSESCSE